jgi:NADH-quinone oxidoreductase subunit F
VASFDTEGLEAVPFPPSQTTICPLGPSSVAPITSAIRRFRHEFEALITRSDSIPVASEAGA